MLIDVYFKAARMKGPCKKFSQTVGKVYHDQSNSLIEHTKDHLKY